MKAPSEILALPRGPLTWFANFIVKCWAVRLDLALQYRRTFSDFIASWSTDLR